MTESTRSSIDLLQRAIADNLKAEFKGKEPIAVQGNTNVSAFGIFEITDNSVISAINYGTPGWTDFVESDIVHGYESDGSFFVRNGMDLDIGDFITTDFLRGGRS